MEKPGLSTMRAYLLQWKKINDNSSPGMSEREMVNEPGDFFPILLLGIEGEKREPHAPREWRWGVELRFRGLFRIVQSLLSLGREEHFEWARTTCEAGKGVDSPLFAFTIFLRAQFAILFSPILALRVQCLPLPQYLFLRRRFLNPKSHSLSTSGISLPLRSALPFILHDISYLGLCTHCSDEAGRPAFHPAQLWQG